MDSVRVTHWLQPSFSGCASCSDGRTEPACLRPADPADGGAPVIEGDHATAQRVLQALRSVTATHREGDLVEAGQIRALRIDPGEAELTLSFPPLCGAHQQVADAAFQVLRRELPDTDVYVVHADH